uniref:Uncharacterized protein n=1 Tax=Arundo donax TaxID=35708 RepID=A0A0A8Y1G8_ARUDO
MYISMRLVPSTIVTLYRCCLMYSWTNFPFSRADKLIHAEMTLTSVTSSGLIPCALMLSKTASASNDWLFCTQPDIIVLQETLSFSGISLNMAFASSTWPFLRYPAIIQFQEKRSKLSPLSNNLRAATTSR